MFGLDLADNGNASHQFSDTAQHSAPEFVTSGWPTTRAEIGGERLWEVSTSALASLNK